MTVAKEIIVTLVHLINNKVVSYTKIQCFSLPSDPFKQKIKMGKCWLSNLEEDDYGLGKWINISIQYCKITLHYTQKTHTVYIVHTGIESVELINVNFMQTRYQKVLP